MSPLHHLHTLVIGMMGLGMPMPIEKIFKGGAAPTPFFYVTENGANFYVTENGSTNYVTETSV